jgi:hypothetical protein
MNKLNNTLLIIVASLFCLTLLFLGPKFQFLAKYSGVGDYFNGILSPFLGIITIILIYRTFRLQKQELQKTSEVLILQKEELQKTSEAFWIQNFETFLNSAVNTLNEIFTTEIYVDLGQIALIGPGRYDPHIKARNFLIDFAKENKGLLNSEMLHKIRTEPILNEFKKLYSKYIQLYHVLARKIDQSNLDKSEKEVYMILIHSKLHNDAIEAILMFILSGANDSLLTIFFKNNNYVFTLFRKMANEELCQLYDIYQSVPALWPSYIQEQVGKS